MTEVVEVTGTVSDETGLLADLMAARLKSAGQSTSGLNFLGSNALVHQAVGLFDSRTAIPEAKDSRAFGTLVGMFSLEDNTVSNADPIQGSLLVDSSTMERVDGNNTKFTYVGEFGTSQAIGQFDRMVLFGATRGNSPHRNTPELNMYHLDNEFKLAGRRRLGGYIAPRTGSTSPVAASSGSSYIDITNGWMVSPKTLKYTTANELVLNVYRTGSAGINLGPMIPELNEATEISVPLPDRPDESWRVIKVRIAPNGDVYVFDTSDERAYALVYIMRAADNWTKKEYGYIILPETPMPGSIVQFRIGEDGVLTTFHIPEGEATTLKVTKYALNDLLSGTPYLSMDMGHEITYSYFVNDLVHDAENQIVHLFMNKHRAIGNNSNDSDNYYESYSSSNVSVVKYDLTGNTPPIISGLAAVGTVLRGGLPNVSWAFGTWNEYTMSKVLDGGMEAYPIGSFGQTAFIFNHKTMTMQGFMLSTYDEYFDSDGEIVEWAFVPTPHFTSALAVIDIPTMTKANDAQLRAILEVTVTHS